MSEGGGGGGSVPELISELLRSILPSTYSSQKTFSLFPTHPSCFLDLSFQSPHLRLWRPSQQLLRDFQRETLELAILTQALNAARSPMGISHLPFSLAFPLYLVPMNTPSLKANPQLCISSTRFPILLI